MRTGRPKPPLIVTDDERHALERYVRRGTTAQRLALRARIVLRCADGQENVAVARQLQVTPHTVGKWRRRFLRDRLDGLVDAPRTGAPRAIGDDRIEALVSDTLGSTPGGAARWSTRLMARRSGMSRSSVSRIWRAFGLEPRLRSRRDPDLVAKPHDVVGLYLGRGARALVLRVDAGARSRRLDLAQATPAARLAALDALTAGATEGDGALELGKFLEEIDAGVPAGVPIHVVLDRDAPRRAPTIRRWLARRPRAHLHLMPTRRRWLDLVARQLQRGPVALGKAIEQALDRDPRPFVWTTPARKE